MFICRIASDRPSAYGKRFARTTDIPLMPLQQKAFLRLKQGGSGSKTRLRRRRFFQLVLFFTICLISESTTPSRESTRSEVYFSARKNIPWYFTVTSTTSVSPS
jgi:hypothetical protein